VTIAFTVNPVKPRVFFPVVGWLISENAASDFDDECDLKGRTPVSINRAIVYELSFPMALS
jgi:hypothetical protein